MRRFGRSLSLSRSGKPFWLRKFISFETTNNNNNNNNNNDNN